MLEPLEHEKILAAIELRNRKKLVNLAIFETIDSTNSFLLNSAKSGAASGSVCLAEQQTQGRGRRGRPWKSPLGANIYCSLLWRFSRISADKTGLSLAIAVMVLNALKKYGIENKIQLKWPNDILLNGRKLAGILLESSDPSNVIIGIGLNVMSTPEDENAACLAEVMNIIPMRNVVTGLLLNELLVQLDEFELNGLRSFVNEWRRHDMLFGKEVTVFFHDKTLKGVMRGIDEKGNLLLQTAKGEMQKFCYGEVSVRLN